MKSTFRKLIPSIIMVLIAATMAGTSTFAWFSMNNKVTVTGMTVTTKVSSNLLISETYNGTYGNGLAQTRTGTLEPASTVDGENFFYTDSGNVLGTGAANEDKYFVYSETETGSATVTAAGKTKYDVQFNTNYGNNPYTEANAVFGYIDYSFFLKATNAEAANRNVILNQCNILYNGQAATERAWRVALFVNDYGADVAVTDMTDEVLLSTVTKTTILAPASAENFESGKAADSTDTRGAVAYGTAATLGAVAPGKTHYYKVLVRLWLEGEDNTCNNNTYAALTAGNWALELGFEISASTGITVLGTTAVGATAVAKVGTVTLSETTTGKLTNGESPVTFAWKNAYTGTAAAGTGADTYEFTATDDGYYYCEITVANGTTFRTAVLNLKAA